MTESPANAQKAQASGTLEGMVHSSKERADDATYDFCLRNILTTAIHKRATTIRLGYNPDAGKTEIGYASDTFGREYMYNRDGHCVFSQTALDHMISRLEAYVEKGKGVFTVSIPMVNAVTFKLDVQTYPSGKTAELKATYGQKSYH